MKEFLRHRQVLERSLTVVNDAVAGKRSRRNTDEWGREANPEALDNTKDRRVPSAFGGSELAMTEVMRLQGIFDLLLGRMRDLKRVTGAVFLLSALFSISAIAQGSAEIDPQMTSSGGEIQQGEFGELFSTMGEPLASDSMVVGASDETTWIGFWQVVPNDTTSGVSEEWAPFGSGGSGITVAAPNPFSEEVQIYVRLQGPGEVRLVACDLLGREAQILIDGHREAGTTRVHWSPVALDAGTYIVKLEIDGTEYPTKTVQYVK